MWWNACKMQLRGKNCWLYNFVHVDFHSVRQLLYIQSQQPAKVSFFQTLCYKNRATAKTYLFFVEKKSFSSASQIQNSKTTISVLVQSGPHIYEYLSSEAMRLFAYESNTSVSTSMFETFLSPATETWLDLDPELNVCSDDISGFSIPQRKCLHKHERPLR